MNNDTAPAEKILENEKLTALTSVMPLEKIVLLDRYLTAISNFYQVIPLKRAFRIINDQNDDKYTEEQFLAFAEVIWKDDEYHNHYVILGKEELYDDAPDSLPFDRVLVHESIVDVDLDIYYAMEIIKREKPYYVPPKDELLKYEDDLYHEPTPQYLAMCEFIAKETGHDKNGVEGVMDELLFNIKTEDSSPDNALRFAGAFDKKMRFNEKQYDKFSALYYDLHNNTRNPYNNGFTPAELYKMNGNAEKSYYFEKPPRGISKLNVFADESDSGFPEEHNIPVKKTKVGRNDPCPCGSGKKYKKCCGQ